MDMITAQVCEFFGVTESQLYQTPEPVLEKMHELMKAEEILDLHKLGYYIPVISERR